MMVERGVVEVVEAVEERAGARNRLVSETAMVHGVVVLLVPPPITLSLGGRSGRAGCYCAHASRLWSEQDLRDSRDHRCSMRAAGGWRVGRRGLSTLMRWQARGLAGFGLQKGRGQPARAWEQPRRRNKLEPPLQSQVAAPLSGCRPRIHSDRQAASSHSNRDSPS